MGATLARVRRVYRVNRYPDRPPVLENFEVSATTTTGIHVVIGDNTTGRIAADVAGDPLPPFYNTPGEATRAYHDSVSERVRRAERELAAANREMVEARDLMIRHAAAVRVVDDPLTSLALER